MAGFIPALIEKVEPENWIPATIKRQLEAMNYYGYARKCILWCMKKWIHYEMGLK
jgi:hypothetical protein